MKIAPRRPGSSVTSAADGSMPSIDDENSERRSKKRPSPQPMSRMRDQPPAGASVRRTSTIAASRALHHQCASYRRRYARPYSGSTLEPRDDVDGPGLHLFIDPAHVLANHAHEEDVHAREKRHEDRQRREPGGRAVENEPGVERVHGEHERERDRRRAHERRRPQRHNGEGKNPIRREPEQLQNAVLAGPGGSRVALDRNADLTESRPDPQAAQIAVALRRRANVIDDAPRHETEIAGIERQPEI